MDCAFCYQQEIKERIIIENNLVRAFPTNMPVVPGHILICPVRHVTKMDDLEADELLAMWDLRSKLREALIKAFEAGGFNYAWNEGKLAGQSVPHLHLHMLPRKEGDAGVWKYEPRDFLYRPRSREETPQKELIAVAKLIRVRY